MQYAEVQNIAKKTMEFMKEKIQPGMTLLEVRNLCEIYFTFEPHICVPNSKYGYKKENIYYFENGVIREL